MAAGHDARKGHSAQDRAIHCLGANCRARSLDRTTGLFARSKRCTDTPGIRSRAVFRRVSGQATQASMRRRCPGFEEPEVAPEKGSIGSGDHGDLRKLFGAGGRFHYRHSTALDSRHRYRRGFTMRIQVARAAVRMLAAATDELVGAARKAPGLPRCFSPSPANTPQVFVDIDRHQGEKLACRFQNVTDAIETYSVPYVNDFNISAATYHAHRASDLPFLRTADLARLRTRNAVGHVSSAAS